MQSLMSRQAGPSSQGELQGVLASLAGVAAIISPLFMSELFARFSAADAPVELPGAPFLVASALVLVCAVIGWRWAPAVMVPGGESGEKARDASP